MKNQVNTNYEYHNPEAEKHRETESKLLEEFTISIAKNYAEQNLPLANDVHWPPYIHQIPLRINEAIAKCDNLHKGREGLYRGKVAINERDEKRDHLRNTKLELQEELNRVSAEVSYLRAVNISPMDYMMILAMLFIAVADAAYAFPAIKGIVPDTFGSTLVACLYGGFFAYVAHKGYHWWQKCGRSYFRKALLLSPAVIIFYLLGLARSQYLQELNSGFDKLNDGLLSNASTFEAVGFTVLSLVLLIIACLIGKRTPNYETLKELWKQKSLKRQQRKLRSKINVIQEKDQKIVSQTNETTQTEAGRLMSAKRDENHFLSLMPKLINLFITTNLRWRTDKASPPCFKTPVEFDFTTYYQDSPTNN